MRTRVTVDKACEWLNQQLEELGQFRNASTRDPQFRHWRQNTLTVIQRIWPGVTSKSRRFRRVPFSPPSSLADARQIREIFERGCAEAAQILRGWLAEIKKHGIRAEESEQGAPANRGVVEESPELTLDQPPSRSGGRDESERGVRTIDLPPSDAVKAARPRDEAPHDRQAKPASKSRLDAESRSDKLPKPARARTKPAVEAPKKKDTKGQARLKDMLGLGHLAASAGGPDASKLVAPRTDRNLSHPAASDFRPPMPRLEVVRGLAPDEPPVSELQPAETTGETAEPVEGAAVWPSFDPAQAVQETPPIELMPAGGLAPTDEPRLELVPALEPPPAHEVAPPPPALGLAPASPPPPALEVAPPAPPPALELAPPAPPPPALELASPIQPPQPATAPPLELTPPLELLPPFEWAAPFEQKSPFERTSPAAPAAPVGSPTPGPGLAEPARSVGAEAARESPAQTPPALPAELWPALQSFPETGEGASLLYEIVTPEPQPGGEPDHPARLEIGEQVIDLGVLDLELMAEPVPSANERDAVVDTAGAAEIALIATEIDTLDVPQAERDHLQKVLLGLSLSIEGGTMSWDELRAAVALVMSYPAVGRRVMPVLTPFFERAA